MCKAKLKMRLRSRKFKVDTVANHKLPIVVFRWKIQQKYGIGHVIETFTRSFQPLVDLGVFPVLDLSHHCFSNTLIQKVFPENFEFCAQFEDGFDKLFEKGMFIRNLADRRQSIKVIQCFQPSWIKQCPTPKISLALSKFLFDNFKPSVKNAIIQCALPIVYDVVHIRSGDRYLGETSGMDPGKDWHGFVNQCRKHVVHSKAEAHVVILSDNHDLLIELAAQCTMNKGYIVMTTPIQSHLDDGEFTMTARDICILRGCRRCVSFSIYNWGSGFCNCFANNITHTKL